MKSSTALTAYLLVSHGSRDVRQAQEMSRLANMFRKRLLHKICSDSYDIDTESFNRSITAIEKGKPTRVSLMEKRALSHIGRDFYPAVQSNHILSVETAYLELAPQPLHERICQIGYELISAGIRKLVVVPVFLMAGTHVMEDIPDEVSTAQTRLGDALTVHICSHLGSHPKMASVLKQRLSSLTTGAALLVAHGSRRQRGNKAIQQLAQQLDAPVAYWAVPPDIESQVILLMQQGYQGITIMPYFLFAGGITDAIAHRTEELAERFPKITFRLLPTLGATEEIADLVVDLI